MQRRSDRKRLLEKLLRELVRTEAQTADHVAREERRIGDTPPTRALRAVAAHVEQMRPRLRQVIDSLGASVSPRFGIRLSTLRQLVAEHNAERAYRGALLDLRHGVDVVRVLREVAHLEELFALIRWCDDWLAARRTLVERVEAQLGWFSEPVHRPDPSGTSSDSSLPM